MAPLSRQGVQPDLEVQETAHRPRCELVVSSAVVSSVLAIDESTGHSPISWEKRRTKNAQRHRQLSCSPVYMHP
jgi:hypothetical protein